MDSTSRSEIVWRPAPNLVHRTRLSAFMEKLNRAYATTLSSFDELYSWSLANRDGFWREVLAFCDIIGEGDPATAFVPAAPGSIRGKWFPDYSLNYAENLLRRDDNARAIIFNGENVVTRTLSFRAMYDEASRVAALLRSLEVMRGDRVAAFVPNAPETVCAMLGATACGAVWSSCSPDFGADAACDRFGQISPRILFAADCYFHKGVRIDCLPKVSAIAERLPSVERIVIFSYDGTTPSLDTLTGRSRNLTVPWQDLPAPSAIRFERLPFSHPLFIMFSSGTTGKPKCIIHSAGGTLLEHTKELVLHTDLQHDERIFYQTTCGWMMWNWLVSSLSAGAALLLYDGSPLHEDGRILWRLADENRATVFGTNAKYLALLEKEGVSPKKIGALSSLSRLLSTGSPLLPGNFDFVHREIKADLQISSISGGTDIIGCFALGSPISPVRRGRLQVRSLGLAVDVFDDRGKPIVGALGELVCTNPFPSMPVGFLGDVDDRKFLATYFERFPGVWTHGDFAELDSDGSIRIVGRSDATLNPGGVRIGTAEIYQQIENFPEVSEAAAVSFEHEGDSKFVLLVRMSPGSALSVELEASLKSTLRKNLSPFHVPWKITAIGDLPRTRNGKLMEMTVRDVLNGRPVTNRDSIANPESLVFLETVRQDLRSETN